MSKFIKFVVWFAVSIGALAVKGYAVSMLWLWFIVSGFHVPTIGIAQGIGISALATMLTKQMSRAEAERSDAHSYALTTAYAIPLAALLIGYITKQFM